MENSMLQLRDIVARVLRQPEIRVLIEKSSVDGQIVETALLSALSLTYLSERQLAERWAVSGELLQKLRRIGRGPRPSKLSAGVVRYALSDVLSHEASSRKE